MKINEIQEQSKKLLYNMNKQIKRTYRAREVYSKSHLQTKLKERMTPQRESSVFKSVVPQIVNEDPNSENESEYQMRIPPITE
jgi:hypothetical protein